MVNTTIQYLACDKLYETEKPYLADFEVEEHNGAKKTNYILFAQPVTVHAIQPSDKFDLNINGFCVINAKINLEAQDALTKPEAIESAYLKEIEAILYERFPEYGRLEPMEFVASYIPAFLICLHCLQNMGLGQKTR
jgi:hypothetical protein